MKKFSTISILLTLVFSVVFSSTAFAVETSSLTSGIADTASCALDISSLTSSISGKGTSQFSQSVPVGDTLNQADHDYQKLKESKLDCIAYSLAKQTLASLTASVVDWINSGFDGSPSFLSNPTGFFMDTADQITGSFISNSGLLSNLCTPFKLDLRLALALQLSANFNSSKRNRYSCTLSTIINNAKNVGSNSVTVNGQNVDKFMAGDFSKGGWVAFGAVTADSQNSPDSAYLSAKGEIEAGISTNNAALNQDINRGMGFMSYKKCTTLGTATNFLDADTYDEEFSGDSTVTRTVNSDGSITYKSCVVQTPGSVISESLNKQLGAGTDQLNAAHEVNEIIGALFGQLMKNVLKEGLLSTSQSSGVSASYVSQLSTDYSNTSNAQKKTFLLNSVNGNIADATTYESLYSQAATQIQSAKGLATDAKTCRTKDPSVSGTYKTEITEIENLDSSINTLYTTISTNAADALNRRTTLEDVRTTANSSSKASDLESAYNAFTDLKQVTQADLATAKNDLQMAQTLKNSAQTYKNSCPQTGNII